MTTSGKNDNFNRFFVCRHHQLQAEHPPALGGGGGRGGGRFKRWDVERQRRTRGRCPEEATTRTKKKEPMICPVINQREGKSAWHPSWRRFLDSDEKRGHHHQAPFPHVSTCGGGCCCSFFLVVLRHWHAENHLPHSRHHCPSSSLQQERQPRRIRQEGHRQLSNGSPLRR